MVPSFDLCKVQLVYLTAADNRFQKYHTRSGSRQSPGWRASVITWIHLASHDVPPQHTKHPVLVGDSSGVSILSTHATHSFHTSVSGFEPATTTFSEVCRSDAKCFNSSTWPCCIRRWVDIHIEFSLFNACLVAILILGNTRRLTKWPIITGRSHLAPNQSRSVRSKLRNEVKYSGFVHVWYCEHTSMSKCKNNIRLASKSDCTTFVACSSEIWCRRKVCHPCFGIQSSIVVWVFIDTFITHYPQHSRYQCQLRMTRVSAVIVIFTIAMCIVFIRQYILLRIKCSSWW